MKKVLSILIAIFTINYALSQMKSDSLIIKEIGRTGKESNFIVTKSGDKYFIRFFYAHNDKDSLYVSYKSKSNYTLKAEIEALDTLELERILYKGESAVLIKTAGNILIKHILILKKKKAKLLERVKT